MKLSLNRPPESVMASKLAPMRILCTRHSSGDLRMLGSVMQYAPAWMDMLQINGDLDKGLPFDAILTCSTRKVGMFKALFPEKPLILMPHNSAPIKLHYWLKEDLEAADTVLTTGKTMREKALRIHPSTRLVRVPYPRLAHYRQSQRAVYQSLSEPIYDVVFACTAYQHYERLAGMPQGVAFWHKLIEILAATGLRVAVLRHGEDTLLPQLRSVEYFDQPQPAVLFSGRWVISDFSSNGLLAATLGHPTLQVVDERGEVEPYLNSERGLLTDMSFRIGPLYGREWSAESVLDHRLNRGDLAALWHQYKDRALEHLDTELELPDLYEQLRETIACLA